MPPIPKVDLSFGNYDPLNVRGRLYEQISDMLRRMEEEGDQITTRERIAALAAIGRLEVIFTALRAKDSLNDPGRGSSVRKYSAAFKANGPRRRTTPPGPSGFDLEVAAATAESDDDIGI